MAFGWRISSSGGRKTPLKRFAIAVLIALFAVPGLASADSRTITFESPTYHVGTIDGQEGWAGSGGLPILPTIDQAVVANTGAPASFGGQSWRFSDAWTDGQFGLWPFSPSLTNEAGETSADGGIYSGGVRQSHYEVQWDFTSAAPNAEQVGLQVSTASDRGDGARMTYIRMEDNPGGLEVFFVEYRDNAPYGTAIFPSTVLTPNPGCGDEDAFVETSVASGLSRSGPHTVKLTIDFVDGTRNDVVKVYVDGTLRHTGTSWEDYFRYCEGNPPRTVDSQIFQARGFLPTDSHPANAGRGFLLDNLSYSTSRTPQSSGDCKNGGWQSLTRADGSSFRNQGDCIQYFNTGK
jgi:hypothetical protein